MRQRQKYSWTQGKVGDRGDGRKETERREAEGDVEKGGKERKEQKKRRRE